MPPDGIDELTLRMLFAQVLAAGVFRLWRQHMELRGIEQATMDREFWDLVNDAG